MSTTTETRIGPSVELESFARIGGIVTLVAGKAVDVIVTMQAPPSAEINPLASHLFPVLGVGATLAVLSTIAILGVIGIAEGLCWAFLKDEQYRPARVFVRLFYAVLGLMWLVQGVHNLYQLGVV